MDNDLFEPINPISQEPSQNEIDLAIAKYQQYHPDYVWAGIRTDIRDELNQRWITVRDYCEQNFATELSDKEKYDSRLWELNCRYIFQDQLVRRPKDGEPDIISDDFLIECVVPAPNGVPKPLYDGSLVDYPTDQIARRITQALVDKLAQLEARLANTSATLDYNSKPYIIAIGLPQAEYLSATHMNGMDITEAILIGAGPLQITINTDGSNARLNVSSQQSIKAKSGAVIPTAYFQRSEWNKVSAVMWSADWLTKATDLKVFLNPNASVPLDPSSLGVDAQIISYTKQTDGYTRDQKLES